MPVIYLKKPNGFAHPLLFLIGLLIVLGLLGGFNYQKKYKQSAVPDYPQVAGVNDSPCTPNLIVGASETHKTLDSALKAVGSNGAGKTICLRNDKVYGPAGAITASGSATSPFVIMGHPDNPTVNGTKKAIIRDDTPYPNWRDRENPNVKQYNAVVLRGNNQVLRDIEVARASKQGVVLGGTGDNDLRENIKVINVVVHDTFGDGIGVLYGKNIKIENCELYRNEMVGAVTDCMKQPNAICSIGEVLKVRHSENVTVENCSIREDMSKGRGGILNTDSKNTTYRNNEIYMNTGNLLHIGDAANVVLENNLVYATCGDKANGLYKLAERYPPTTVNYKWKGGTGYTLRNNLIVGMARGINFGGCEGYLKKKCNEDDPNWPECRNNPNSDYTQKIWPEGHACPMDNVLIENNTVVGTGNQNSNEDEPREHSLVINDFHGDPVSNWKIKNNIFHSVDDDAVDHDDVFIQALGDISFTNNIWHDRSPLGQGDVQIKNLTGVFTGNPNLGACITGRIDKNKYKVSNAYQGKGADITKVGRFASTDDEEQTPLDTDGDGVKDADDLCPTQPAGANPDPARRGCPINEGLLDTDNDGILNREDVCPTEPAGPNPDTDPLRKGCPSIPDDEPQDSDGDGVIDAQDKCPNVPAGAEPDPDPLRKGCPLDVSSTGTNIVKNPVFKLPASSTYEFAKNWTYTRGKMGMAKASITRAGKDSLAINEMAKLVIVRNPLTGYVALNQKNVDLDPNTDYTVSFVAKSSAVGKVYMTFRDMGLLQETLAPSIEYSVNTTWALYEASIKTVNFNPSKAAQIYIGFRAANGSELLIDTIVIKKK